MYKHIIWDFDGTLFDTYTVMATAAQLTLREDGIEEPLEDIIRLMKISITHAFDYYAGKYNINQAFADRYTRRRREMELEVCKPYLGAVEFCRYVHESGRYNYMNTHRGASTIDFLRVNQIEEYFTECVTSQYEFERKPSPEAIDYLITKYNIKREEAIMIGDRDLDILSGKNAGIRTCFFDDQGNTSDIADFSVSNYDQLYSIIG